MLVATEYSFMHTSLDYAYKFNVLLNNKDALVCERALAFLYAQNMFYMQVRDGLSCVAASRRLSPRHSPLPVAASFAALVHARVLWAVLEPDG